MNYFIFTVVILYVTSVIVPTFAKDERELLLVTVATNETQGFQRFMRSTKVYGINVKVLGMGSVWNGGAMKTGIGGGQKVGLLKKEIERYKDREDVVVLFTDSYDVLLLGDKTSLLKAFDSLDAKVAFGAEDFCWPDRSLRTSYPKVTFGYKYLNSGGFMGYAPVLHRLLSYEDVSDADDDQLFYTKAFLNETLREELQIKLDSKAKIFQNLNGNSEDVNLSFLTDETRLLNTAYETHPLVVHGNGPSKGLLNFMGNYLPKAWDTKHGCTACDEGMYHLPEKESDWPVILVGVFVERPTPFLEEALMKVALLEYPKGKIHLLVHNQVSSHATILQDWLAKQKSAKFASVKFISHEDNIKEWHARNLAIDRCLTASCSAFLSIDSEAHLDNTRTLTLLLRQNRPILCAMLTRVGKAWSTFWGAVTDQGYYSRSLDYMDIINYNRRGVWNVPHISGVYLIQSSILSNPETRPNYIHKLMDADMAMTYNLRDKDIFMYVTNTNSFGHLVDSDVVTTSNLHNDLWQVAANNYDWELKYLHPLYYQALEEEANDTMPCPDVYWLPLFSETFCKELIETMESNGEWSLGGNKDPRLAGGYENVPTVDIHMNQVEFEQEWFYILKTYVKPLAEKVFLGYTSDARAIMNFVVKYNPEQQYFLRPHHDSSTYTINVGLNRPGIDYEGGGARFIRYNCSVTHTKIGWALMHPGRLTHYHEGLPTTRGTRYILISFIDP